VRQVAKTLPFLIPGIGAQGGDLIATVKAGKTADGGMLINSSRAILYADATDQWQKAAAKVAQQTRDDINAAL
jgi:orotidine-5'-phosphate decarboxylase